MKIAENILKPLYLLGFQNLPKKGHERNVSLVVSLYTILHSLHIVYGNFAQILMIFLYNFYVTPFIENIIYH